MALVEIQFLNKPFSVDCLNKSFYPEAKVLCPPRDSQDIIYAKKRCGPSSTNCSMAKEKVTY